jgi:hypothetical protein
MSAILGLGLSHYPPLCLPDEEMSGILRWTMQDPSIPASALNSANWPAPMRDEWSDDLGTRAAAQHRRALVAGFERVRAALDEFRPDVVLIWGDDQYENFREDLIPPFAILAFDDLDLYPWYHAQPSSMIAGKANVWGEDASKHYRLRGRRDIAKHLVTALLGRGFDVAYAYKPLHHESLGHAFINTILYLDYCRRGYDYATICFPLNCYGRRVISWKGSLTRIDSAVELDPPSPSPGRVMELGAATARILKESPWKVALIASSSWSHAFLCNATWRMRPFTVDDRLLYDALCVADYSAWQATTLASVEKAGQHEMLNWFALVGAMKELGARLRWSQFVETHVFNSNKVFAVFEPA